MARVLFFCTSYPADISSGEFLRIHNFCEELAARHDCYLIYLADSDDEHDPQTDLGVKAWQRLAPIPTRGRSNRRLFRLSNARLLELSVPGYLRETREKVEGLCATWNIDVILCLAPKIAEIVNPINLPKILEYCDSGSLTLSRILSNRGEQLSFLEKAGVRLRKLRQGNLERAYVRAFDCTTTISEPDKNSFVEVSGVSADKVAVIPNGVAPEALAAGEGSSDHKRSVVFWGNLDFPPNWTAVEYFHENIYVPFLAEKEIEWHILGSGASESIQRIAEHKGVFLHGFVDDLFSEVSRHGVMINPMVEGSGLKNKVLEAFACRVPVVSTSLGIEAIGATPDVHYLNADTPEDFADAVTRLLTNTSLASEIAENARQLVESNFQWGVIGERLESLIDHVASRKSPKGS
jgi:glycosyltransferase involved in cell wall biosynthesis